VVCLVTAPSRPRSPLQVTLFPFLPEGRGNGLLCLFVSNLLRFSFAFSLGLLVSSRSNKLCNKLVAHNLSQHPSQQCTQTNGIRVGGGEVALANKEHLLTANKEQCLPRTHNLLRRLVNLTFLGLTIMHHPQHQHRRPAAARA